MVKIKDELNKVVCVFGLINLFVLLICNWIDMFFMGIKSLIGIKVLGIDLVILQQVVDQIEMLVGDVLGVSLVIVEWFISGCYVNVYV